MSSISLHVRLPSDLYEQLPEPSLVRGEGRNAFIVQAVREKLEREKETEK